MKFCVDCNEQIEDQFESCWQCGKPLENYALQDVSKKIRDKKSKGKMNDSKLLNKTEEYTTNILVIGRAACYLVIILMSFGLLRLITSEALDYMASDLIVVLFIIQISHIVILLGIAKTFKYVESKEII